MRYIAYYTLFIQTTPNINFLNYYNYNYMRLMIVPVNFIYALGLLMSTPNAGFEKVLTPLCYTHWVFASRLLRGCRRKKYFS